MIVVKRGEAQLCPAGANLHRASDIVRQGVGQRMKQGNKHSLSLSAVLVPWTVVIVAQRERQQ